MSNVKRSHNVPKVVVHSLEQIEQTLSASRNKFCSCLCSCVVLDSLMVTSADTLSESGHPESLCVFPVLQTSQNAH